MEQMRETNATFYHQVLNMAVDDADLQLDFSSNNHAFNIHSVQYLSKENGEHYSLHICQPIV